MKTLNYLLILIAIAAVCIAALFDRGIYRIPFLIVALMLLAASSMHAGYAI